MRIERRVVITVGTLGNGVAKWQREMIINK